MPDRPEHDNDDLPFDLPHHRDEKPRSPSDTELRAQDRPEPIHPDAVTGHFVEIDDSGPVDPNARTVPYERASDNAGDATEDIEVPSDDEVMAMHRERKRRAIDPYADEREDDHDIPFDLPRAGQAPQNDVGKLGQRMVTLPSDGDLSAPTLLGSGGLDPNPDFPQPNAAPTMRSMPPVPTAQSGVYQAPPTQPPYQPGYYAPPPPNQGGGAMPGAARGKGLPRRRARRRGIGCMAVFIGLALTFCGGLTLIGGVGGLYAYARVGDLLNERLSQFDEYDAFQSTFLYDRSGTELFEVFNEGRRTEVRLDEIPDHLINATVAIEDDEFWTNIGIDVAATTVAVLSFLGADSPDDVAGGSTITQQLVRNVLFDPAYRAERSATRKAEEILLAIALTGRKSKEEILETYLNEIYYGNLAYGAGAAAQIFFGKDVSTLTLGEAALLAGLPQAPAELDPLNPDPEVQQAVENRWKLVLTEMVEEGYITSEERDQALREGYSLVVPDISLRAPHFTVYAQGQLERLMNNLGYGPEEIARGGLQVYTTVDLTITDLAQTAVAEQVAKLRVSNNVGNGAAVVINPQTGEILAMIGSADYNDDSIDGRVNVTTALRQPGSTMKPFTYSGAMERGMTPGDVIWDTKTRIGIPGQPAYEPVNYDRRFHGPMRLREALANSYNVPAVQTLRHWVGVDYLLDLMTRFGVTTFADDPGLYGLSLTLGGGEISLVELTNAYAVFANDGHLVQLQAIRCVLDNDDNIIYQYENGCPMGQTTDRTISDVASSTRVLDPRISFIISDVLSDNAARTPAMGGSSPLNTPGITSAVKTGTTDDNKDNWTIGYTKNVAIGVWVGNSRGEPMVGTSGLSGAAPIWNTIITSIYNQPELLSRFAYRGQLRNDAILPPQGVSQQQMCNLDTMIDPVAQCGGRVTEWMLDGPAGVPDLSGVMQYPQAAVQDQQAPSSSSYVLPDSPGVYRAVVHPVDPAVAVGIQFPVEPGYIAPPPPIYCRVPADMIATTPGVVEQLFITPPPNPNDAAEAEHYARNLGLAFLPTIDCNDQLMASEGGFGGLPMNVVAANITAPVAGQAVPPEGLWITGTVDYNPAVVDFYGFLIRSVEGGNFPNWTSIGDIHRERVIDAALELLPGYPGLQPGRYELRLDIVGLDGALLQVPVTVPFVVQ